jgi:hypothetical protein
VIHGPEKDCAFIPLVWCLNKPEIKYNYPSHRFLGSLKAFSAAPSRALSLFKNRKFYSLRVSAFGKEMKKPVKSNGEVEASKQWNMLNTLLSLHHARSA